MHCSYEGGTSTYGPLHHALEVLASIVRYVSQRHPLTFFGVPGVLSLLYGLYMGVTVIYKFNMSRMLPVGTALLTAIFILAGIFSLFTGIILYSVGNQIARLKLYRGFEYSITSKQKGLKQGELAFNEEVAGW